MNTLPSAPPKPFIYNPPQQPYLNILYQDEWMLALSKPSGLLTVPGKAAEHADCLESRVQESFPEAKVVHRLDMDTSGVLIMSRDKASLANLSMQFEKRTTKKFYIAEVYGQLLPETGTINQPLICDWPNRPKQMIDLQRGKEAITHWEVIDYSETANKTRIKLTPITGRSHQLRVHMASLGHPILGDNLYAHEDAFHATPRLMLHAEYLAVKHPHNKEPIEFYCKAAF